LTPEHLIVEHPNSKHLNVRTRENGIEDKKNAPGFGPLEPDVLAFRALLAEANETEAIGKLRRQVAALITECGEELVAYALRETITQNKASFAYVAAVARNHKT